MARTIAVVPSCSCCSTVTLTWARLSSVSSMLSTVPTGWPPIRTWLSGTSWLAFWKRREYLVTAVAAEDDVGEGEDNQRRGRATAAIRAGAILRPDAGLLSSPKGLAATSRRLPFPGLQPGWKRRANRIRGVPGQARAQAGLNWNSTRYSGRAVRLWDREALWQFEQRSEANAQTSDFDPCPGGRCSRARSSPRPRWQSGVRRLPAPTATPMRSTSRSLRRSSLNPNRPPPP